jgi:phosphoglycerate dehydrogenase-like enzyme
MFMKAVFTYDYGKEKLDRIRALGYEIELVHENEIENSSAVNEAEILVCYNPFKRLDISKMKKLKWIQLSSVGFDQLPTEKAVSQGITVTNNRGGYSKPMGEWIVMNILEIYKHRKNQYKDQSRKVWKLDSSISEIVGKKVAFLGTGTIAQEAAKRLQGFEAQIIGFNTSGHSSPYFDKCYAMNLLDDMLGQIDVVVVTLPSTEKTHHFMNADRLDRMRDDSVLINVSRGSNIDENALIDALKSDKFLGVALDVFEKEPLSEDSPFWSIERVYFSAHNSWVSQMKNERRFELIYRNMKHYSNKEPLENTVNIERGY